MSNESVVGMWKEYKKNNPNVPKYYEAWAFGHSIEMANELAKLVLDGTKTATFTIWGK